MSSFWGLIPSAKMNVIGILQPVKFYCETNGFICDCAIEILP